MNDIYLISHIKPDNKNTKFYLLKDGVFEVKTNIDDILISDNTIVSFDFNRLIRHIKEQKYANIVPPNIFDIESAARLLVGKPKSEFENSFPWSIWTMMEENFYAEDKKELEKIRRLYFGIDLVENNQNVKELFERFIREMKKLYENLKEKLTTQNEYQRFIKIEKKISQIILERTSKGIHFDNDSIQKKINKYIKFLYRIKNKLQLEYSIFRNNDKKHIRQNLKKLGYNYISYKLGVGETDEYKRLLKLARRKDFLIFLLYQEEKISRNLTILQRIGDLKQTIIYPEFETVGTVTSRILVEYPRLQQLSKIHRDIIIPEGGKELIYVDYSQFEAGILASECEDNLLIQAYEKDIYSELSKQVFGDVNYRDICKKLFFMYSYGMKIENIAKEDTIQEFLKDFFPNKNASELEGRIKSFFGRFPKLEEYRKVIEDEVMKNKKICTKFGNNRYANESEKGEIVKINWALSQRIQGMASYILKKAIIEVYEADKEIEFLLPMHDAVLYQVPKNKKMEKEEKIKSIFIKNYKEVCPNLGSPKCEVKEFAEEKKVPCFL